MILWITPRLNCSQNLSLNPKYAPKLFSGRVSAGWAHSAHTNTPISSAEYVVSILHQSASSITRFHGHRTPRPHLPPSENFSCYATAKYGGFCFFSFKRAQPCLSAACSYPAVQLDYRNGISAASCLACAWSVLCCPWDYKLDDTRVCGCVYHMPLGRRNEILPATNIW